MCRYQTTVSVYIPHMNSLQSTFSPQALVNLHFTLFTYVPEYICLPHQTCMSHCTSNIVYMKTPHDCTCKSNKAMQCKFIYPAMSIYMPAMNMPLKCHIYSTYANYFMCTYQTTMSVHIPHISSLQSTLSPQEPVKHTFQIIGICP